MHFPWKYRWRAQEPNFFIMARVYIFIHISCKSFFSSALSPLFSSHCSIDRKTFNLGFSPRTARKICGKIFYIDKGSSRWFIYFCVFATAKKLLENKAYAVALLREVTLEVCIFLYKCFLFILYFILPRALICVAEFSSEILSHLRTLFRTVRPQYFIAKSWKVYLFCLFSKLSERKYWEMAIVISV